MSKKEKLNKGTIQMLELKFPKEFEGHSASFGTQGLITLAERRKDAHDKATEILKPRRETPITVRIGKDRIK
jgi:hypothetical protein